MEEQTMITLFVLVVTILSLIIAAALIVLAGGAGLILALGDLIVCGLIIWAVIRLFRRGR